MPGPTRGASAALQNKLLAALPDGDWERMRQHLAPTFLPLGTALWHSGGRPGYAYFPATALISLQFQLVGGASDEIAMVGNEGVLGVTLFMGGSTQTRAVVQNEGWAYQLNRELFNLEFARGGALQHLLLHYAQALLTQVSQLAVCNRHHAIEQQLCRWLLMTIDRLPSDSATVTQERIAHLFGVRREGVTGAAGKLRDAGLIRYNRGRITIVDRIGLERRCCECYSVLKIETDRLLPAPAAHAVNSGSMQCLGRAQTPGPRHPRPDRECLRTVPWPATVGTKARDAASLAIEAPAS
jgi:hypothetical protein